MDKKTRKESMCIRWADGTWSIDSQNEPTDWDDYEKAINDLLPPLWSIRTSNSVKIQVSGLIPDAIIGKKDDVLWDALLNSIEMIGGKLFARYEVTTDYYL